MQNKGNVFAYIGENYSVLAITEPRTLITVTPITIFFTAPAIPNAIAVEPPSELVVKVLCELHYRLHHATKNPDNQERYSGVLKALTDYIGAS